MNKLYLLGLIGITLTGCFWDEPINTRNLVKDFNLSWWSELRYQSLFENKNKNEYGGGVIIPESVFAYVSN
jgi:hypothetical protein